MRLEGYVRPGWLDDGDGFGEGETVRVVEGAVQREYEAPRVFEYGDSPIKTLLRPWRAWEALNEATWGRVWP